MKTIRMSLQINGETRPVVVEPRATLLEALRERCGLKGAAEGCGDGSCGTCTVLVDGEPVRACMMFAVQAHGMAVETVEGLAEGGALSPLQDAFVEAGAPQCGYCTPGYVMLVEGAMRRQGELCDDDAVDRLVATNQCRCGAYEAICEAVKIRTRVPAGG